MERVHCAGAHRSVSKSLSTVQSEGVNYLANPGGVCYTSATRAYVRKAPESVSMGVMHCEYSSGNYHQRKDLHRGG